MDWEREDVEKPFFAQLPALAWPHGEGRVDDHTITDRVRVTPLLECNAPVVQQQPAQIVQQPVGQAGG